MTTSFILVSRVFFCPNNFLVWVLLLIIRACFKLFIIVFCGEFDPGSGRTLAACLTHASRTMKPVLAPAD